MPTRAEIRITQGPTPQESKLGAHPVIIESLAQRRNHLASIRGGPISLIGSPLRTTSLPVLERGAVGASEEDQDSVNAFPETPYRQVSPYLRAAAFVGVASAVALGINHLLTGPTSAQELPPDYPDPDQPFQPRGGFDAGPGVDGVDIVDVPVVDTPPVAEEPVITDQPPAVDGFENITIADLKPTNWYEIWGDLAVNRFDKEEKLGSIPVQVPNERLQLIKDAYALLGKHYANKNLVDQMISGIDFVDFILPKGYVPNPPNAQVDTEGLVFNDIQGKGAGFIYLNRYTTAEEIAAHLIFQSIIAKEVEKGHFKRFNGIGYYRESPDYLKQQINHQEAILSAFSEVFDQFIQPHSKNRYLIGRFGSWKEIADRDLNDFKNRLQTTLAAVAAS